jgi:hypothetical protein
MKTYVFFIYLSLISFLGTAQSSIYLKVDFSGNWNQLSFNRVDKYFPENNYTVLSGGNPHLSVGYILTPHSAVETGIMYRINDLNIRQTPVTLYGLQPDMWIVPSYYVYTLNPAYGSKKPAVSLSFKAGIAALFQTSVRQGSRLSKLELNTPTQPTFRPYTVQPVAFLPMLGISLEAHLWRGFKNYIEYQHWQGFGDTNRFDVTITDRSGRVLQQGYLGQNGTMTSIFFGGKYEF